MKKHLLLTGILALLMFTMLQLSAQVGINTDGSSPDNSAMLDVKSTTRGFLPPRVALTAANVASPVTAPAAGLFVYNTATSGTSPNNVVPGYYCWNGTRWIAAILPQGSAAGDMLYWSGAQWVTVPAGSNGQIMTFNNGIPSWIQPSSILCGLPFTKVHTAGVVAPVSKSVVYGTVNNIPGEPLKCWITQNLGADHQATAPNDTTGASAGWYWQFNHKQGYKDYGLSIIPWASWVFNISENSDWTSSNDPCTIELGTGWRLPTLAEWTNVATAGNWSGGNSPWNSGLKIHYAGFVGEGGPGLASRGSTGFYWSNSQKGYTAGSILTVEANTGYLGFLQKVKGFSVRCLSDAGTASMAPAVTTSAITGISQNSATGGGNITFDGGADVTTRGVCWSTSSNPTTADNLTTNGSGTGSFTSNLTGLTANTLYHVRAYATNSIGTGYGDDATFTTLPPPVIPTVTTIAVTAVTSTAATSGGNVTFDGYTMVTARGVCWSTSPAPTTAGSHTTDAGTTGSYPSSITGLSPATLYYVRAYATNSVGTAYGNEVTFTTLAVIPTLTTATPTDVTSATATSGGNVTSDGGATITARGVCWSTSSGTVATGSHTSDAGTTGSYTSSITGLSPVTLYYVRAYATNSAGTAYGNEVTFTTLPAIPTLTTSDATNITLVTATSGGNVTSDGGASITARGVCWSTSPGPVATGSHTTDAGTTGSYSSSITGLTAGTLYYVRAYATNSVGTAYGAAVTFTTLSCGASFTINHQVSGGVAPVAKTVTYGTVTNIPGETAKCWITSNLGADHQATAVNDATEPSAGWYWQFNRIQGYKHDGTTRTPNTTWINSISETSNWTAANDPCTIELGTGWRLPTNTEWTHVDGLSGGNWTNWNGPWNSGLKLHGAGFLDFPNGSLVNRGSQGNYWSSINYPSSTAYDLNFNSGLSEMVTNNKAYAFTLRCIKDN